MHDFAFADAARPTPVRCLRIPLREYTLGHELLLLRARNEIFCQPQEDFDNLPLEIQTYALRSAVLACSQTWNESQDKQGGIYLWTWLARKCDHQEELAKFRAYLDAAHVMLPRPTPLATEISVGKQPQKGRNLGSPFLAQLVNFIAPRLGALSSDLKIVWDFPFALATHLYFTHLETEGAMYIENAEEAQHRRTETEAQADYKRQFEADVAAGLIDRDTGYQIDPETKLLIDPISQKLIKREDIKP